MFWFERIVLAANLVAAAAVYFHPNKEVPISRLGLALLVLGDVLTLYVSTRL